MIATLFVLAMTATAGASSASGEVDCVQRLPATSGAQWLAWGVDARNWRFLDGAAAGIAPGDVPRLKLKWAFSLGNVANARSQPAVAGGRLFVGTEAGSVFALDAASGCTWWTYKAGMAVRSAIVASPSTAGTRAAVYFGDVGANVHAVDATSGELRWKVEVDNHPTAVVTGAPQLFDGVLYVPVSSYESVLPLQPAYSCCSFRGSVVALEAATGKILWKTHTIDDAAQPTTKSKTGTQLRGPSGAAVWSTPTIDERLDRLYVGTGNNYSDPPTQRSDAILALDRRTGAIVWSRQFAMRDAYNASCDIPGKPSCPASDGPDADFGQPPILVTLPDGRRALVAGQKSGDAHALDPDRMGELIWSVKVGPGGKLGGIHWGSATDGRHLWVAMGGQQIRVLTDSTVTGGFRLEPDPASGGGLFGLNLADGKVLWSAPAPKCELRPRCSPAQSAAITAIPGVVFSGALDGHLRAYSAATGAIVWDFDTVREFETVNGGAARGGSLDVAGPVVAGGMVYVTSGYSLFQAIPGNVLLAFSIEGR
jgi:polyvinyl alcohol dehydrogenase (cytochrome)